MWYHSYWVITYLQNHSLVCLKYSIFMFGNIMTDSSKANKIRSVWFSQYFKISLGTLLIPFKYNLVLKALSTCLYWLNWSSTRSLTMKTCVKVQILTSLRELTDALMDALSLLLFRDDNRLNPDVTLLANTWNRLYQWFQNTSRHF